eukprot:CAMPEP_0172408220 /NCGR_PEP_ID=MMETSP1061-20121228/75741_1 /TAXON_ID=37318 /ORGANISM="Pseudo-nitzschia pungens, Strain cf. pungens" /LENGTH=284 /DNA_ID=CAMNT_0013144341 /DNA_START=182 /DNA_END=1036 /DNA_ORIENTATION=-
MTTFTTMAFLFLLQAAFLAGVCVAFQQQPLSVEISTRQELVPTTQLWMANNNCVAFQQQPLSVEISTRQELVPTTQLWMANNKSNNNNKNSNKSNNLSFSDEKRRNFLASSFAAAATGLFSFRQSASAIPMASVDEFDSILRDSPLSVQIVEFSGPRSESVTVKLVDGTVFGIKGIIESPTDPRSPLKVAAACREANVKTRFVDLEAMLAGATTKKKKMYTNERVQKAYELQAAQKERMRQDELERLRQVAIQEEEQETARVVASEAAAAAADSSSAVAAPLSE